MMVLLFGPPGVGKGTQANLLSARYKSTKFSIGDMLRDEVASKSELGTKIAQYLNNGALVPDDIISAFARQFIEKHKADDILLDGFPRNMNQAQNLISDLNRLSLSLKVAIEMHLNETEIIKRLISRRYCPQCNKIYNYVTNPPRQKQVCDICKTTLIKRSDDNEKLIRKRLAVYEKETQPLVGFYKAHCIYERAEATGSQEEVFKKLSNIIDAYTN